jgi:REP element-mobilizing transposase RayT
MARKLRVEYPGAIYHVLNRGDRREPIFRDDQDCELFLATLGEACQKTGWQVHALCLMPNHFHLVRRLRLETTMTLNWIAKQLKMGTAGSLENLLRKAK